MSTDELLIRPATVADAPAMADLHVDSREANVGSMPAMVHDRETTHRWMRGRLESGSTGWVAEREGRVVGYLVLTGDWLDDLFLAPGETGQGVGSALLDLAKSRRPDGFCLWVFETNAGARRFYRRHGLVELERTDGSGNAERAPDVRLAWPGPDPVGFLRGLIDDVDDELGDLLARRVALTRAVQPHKSDPTRDAAREQEVVRRLAARAPDLGEERLARIVHAVITESLGAHSRQTVGMAFSMDDDLRQFLAAANPAVISTVRPDGQPVSVATWYLLDGDRILVNMDAGRKRLAYLREDPKVSLTVLDADDWYSHVSVQGRVVEWRDDEDLHDIDRLAQQYGNDRYPNRERPRVSAWIEVEHAHTWGKRFG